MKAMIISQYGSAQDVFQYIEEQPLPDIKKNEVLVKNIAASVNPIDTAKRAGYGHHVFSRSRKPEFPYILGCDAAGIVEKVGSDIKKFKQGDQVCYISNSFKQGVYAEFGVAEEASIVHKPKNLSCIDAASIPYVALTAWTALVKKAKLNPDNAQGKKVLVHAGSGGVGSIAIQLLKHWGCFVATTCSSRNVDFVKSLGADQIIDYQTEDYSEILKEYDVVLDTLGFNVPGTEEKSLKILKNDGSATYITLVHPFISNLDKHGLIYGLLKNVWELWKKKIKHRSKRYHWVLYRPCREGFETLISLFEKGVIRPVVDQVFTLEQAADAHNYVEGKRTRGKVVLMIGDEHG